MTRTGMIIGSPGFMSPEQVRGLELGPASDVFCLGSVLAYAATGRLPFGDGGSGGAAALLFRVAEAEPDTVGIPAPFVDLVRECLEKDPQRRPTPGEIAERTADGSAEPWLPGAVLQELARHAAELLDYDAAPMAPTQPAPAPTPAPPAVPAPTASAASADVPAKPPGAPLPRSRPRRSRTVLTVVAAIAVIAAGLLGLRLSGGDDKDAGSGKGGSSKPPSVLPGDFTGTWEGQEDLGGNIGNQRRIRIVIPAGADTAHVETVDAERYCSGRSSVLEVKDQINSTKPVATLDVPQVGNTIPLSKKDGCTQQSGGKLAVSSEDTLYWQLDDRDVQLVKNPQQLPTEQKVPSVFDGHWAVKGDTDGFSADRLMRLQTVDIEVGTSLASGRVHVGLLVGKQGEAVQCFYSAQLFALGRANELFTTPLTTGGPSGSGPCPEMLSPQMIIPNRDGATLSATTLGGKGVNATVAR